LSSAGYDQARPQELLLKRESIVFLISGVVFGLLVGWIIGSQQAAPAAPPAAAAAAPVQPAQTASPPPPVDTARVSQLEQTAKADPSNAAVRVELGDLYFNAERFDQAIPWYEAALELDPKNINASTDLGVCYYYTQQDDRALAQFEHSLKLDPNHVKTLFNQGIVRAFAKQDLEGATKAWERVIAAAPDSQEGKRAKQILDGLKSGHTGAPGAGTPGPPTPPSGQGQ
jgi:cytochrome c-type biogenesis protein CcmH/NrfG